MLSSLQSRKQPLEITLWYIYGTSAALRHFKKEFLELKWSTTNEQKKIDASQGQEQVDAVSRKCTMTQGSTETHARSHDIKKNHYKLIIRFSK